MIRLQTELRKLRQALDAWEPPPAVPTLPPMSALELWQVAMGCAPDPWQQTVLASDDPRIILLCSRQVGKSQTVAVKALHIATSEPRSLILLLSRSLRQSSELARKVFDCYASSGRQIPPESETKLSLELTNGSRIIALPGGDPEAIRGFSAPRAVILDEAARIPDSLYVSVRPMLAVAPRAAMILLSSPFGKRGFFWRVWSESQRWLKIQITAEQCPRLTPDFLAEELIELGPRYYSQEYLCQFLEAIGQVFSDEAIAAAFQDGIAPLFAPDAEAEGLADLEPLFAEA
jgi:Terminase large subunit, T4likevirus-type, N-terminal